MAGTKSMAVALYRRRKTEALQGRKFPESMRRQGVRLKQIIATHIEAVGANQKKTVVRIE